MNVTATVLTEAQGNAHCRSFGGEGAVAPGVNGSWMQRELTVAAQRPVAFGFGGRIA